MVREAAMAGGNVTAVAACIPKVDHWFDSWTQEALAGALAYLDGVADSRWRDRLAVAISAAIVRISRQESDTRYAAVGGSKSRAEAATELGRSVVRVCDWLSENAANLPPTPATVICRDARDLATLDRNSFAAAVFSPPYPNAYEYWLYHKYRMYWLGFDPIQVRRDELGARPHYCKKNGLTASDFRNQMSAVFAGLAHALLPGAPIVVVVGDSIIKGRKVDNGKLLAEAAKSTGLELEASTTRAISGRRSSFNRAHSRARKREHVLLFHAP
ncbi:MAG: hypothetical protein ACM3N0_04460 [Chloroflexota bacterium]